MKPSDMENAQGESQQRARPSTSAPTDSAEDVEALRDLLPGLEREGNIRARDERLHARSEVSEEGAFNVMRHRGKATTRASPEQRRPEVKLHAHIQGHRCAYPRFTFRNINLYSLGRAVEDGEGKPPGPERAAEGALQGNLGGVKIGGRGKSTVHKQESIF
jgi:hypothetical protein